MRFHGPVGYAEGTQQSLTRPGVWEDVIVEVNYTGDVTRDSRRLAVDDNIVSDLSVNNVISIVADHKALHNFHKIRYVLWNDVRWVVTAAEVRAPRLLLTLGEVYNGPTP